MLERHIILLEKQIINYTQFDMQVLDQSYVNVRKNESFDEKNFFIRKSLFRYKNDANFRL